jgi:ATP-binding cassette subfamily F protein 3
MPARMSGGSGTAARYNGRMISFRNFALRRGERLLLSDVDLTLHAGWRVGVIGRNGAGKSSLFAALMREVEADKGDLDLPGKARIASVAQETPHLPDPAIDFVLSGDEAVHAAIQMPRPTPSPTRTGKRLRRPTIGWRS